MLNSKAINYLEIIIFAILIIIILSLKTSLVIGFATGSIVVITLIITNYLFKLKKRYWDFIIIIIAASAFSLLRRMLSSELSLFDIFGNICLALLVYLVAKYQQRKKIKQQV